MKKLLSVLLALSMVLAPISAYSLNTEKEEAVRNNATLKEEGQRTTKNFELSLNKNTVTAIAIICAAVLTKAGMIFVEKVKEINFKANPPGLFLKIFNGMPNEAKHLFSTAFSFIGFNKLAGVKNILFQGLNLAILEKDDFVNACSFLADNVKEFWNDFKKNYYSYRCKWDISHGISSEENPLRKL